MSVKDWIEENQGKYFCQCGCGEPIILHRNHHCQGIPKFKKGHAKTGPKAQSSAERFWRFIDKKDHDTCWNWTGSLCGGRDKPLYGYFRVGSQSDGTRRQVYAHRWIYELFNGEIPNGLQVNHHCDNHRCVNPKHLYLGTQSENVYDMHRRGRARGQQLQPPFVTKTQFKPTMVVVTDSREQKPYKYPSSVVKGLKTGDYSIEGLEDKVVVERKSKTDCYSSLGAGRKRFQKELERMAEFDYAAIVLECSLADFLIPPPFSKLIPKAAINTLISWSVCYGVHIFFAQDRRHGRGVTYRILEKYLKHKDDIHARQK